VRQTDAEVAAPAQYNCWLVPSIAPSTAAATRERSVHGSHPRVFVLAVKVVIAAFSQASSAASLESFPAARAL